MTSTNPSPVKNQSNIGTQVGLNKMKVVRNCKQHVCSQVVQVVWICLALQLGTPSRTKLTCILIDCAKRGGWE